MSISSTSNDVDDQIDPASRSDWFGAPPPAMSLPGGEWKSLVLLMVGIEWWKRG